MCIRDSVKNDIKQESVALAVVVQKLAFSDASGVMFTLNPINGRRSEMIVNAAWGLGESVVSSLVTPDTIVVDKNAERIVSVSYTHLTGNLDSFNTHGIMKLLEEINQRGTTVIVVTHSQEMVDEMNKRVITLSLIHILRNWRLPGRLPRWRKGLYNPLYM